MNDRDVNTARANTRQALDRPPPPRLALTADEAAASLGLSPSSFRRHVAPHVPAIRRGSLRLYPVTALEKWTEENATLAGGQ